MTTSSEVHCRAKHDLPFGPRAQNRWAPLALVVLCAILATPASAQTIKRLPAGGLRQALARELGANPERLHLNLPPFGEPLLGAVITIDGAGEVQVVDRLDSSLYTVLSGRASDKCLFERGEMKPDQTAFGMIFAKPPKGKSRFSVTTRVEHLRERHLFARNDQEFTDALVALYHKNLDRAEDKKLLLVTRIFEGQVQMLITGDERWLRSAKLNEPFRLAGPIDGGVRLTTKQPTTAAAFETETLEFGYSQKTSLPKGIQAYQLPDTVRRAPDELSPAAASPWERVERPPPTAAPAPEKPEASEVTVLYATCREVAVVPTPWSEHFAGFLATTNGLLTAVGLGVLGGLGLLVLGLLRRLNLLAMGLVVVAGMLLYTGAAAVDASQRVRKESAAASTYNNLRGELRYGLCKVSVPEKHVQGHLETPFSLYLVEFPENPEKHFVVTELEEDRDKFLEELKGRVQRSSKQDAFVFIHGYNVSFGDAAKRTAQLCVDLGFEGAPICYSWPSQRELIYYLADETTAMIAADRLGKFLLDLEAQSGAKRIHLIAHSMGNKVLGYALQGIGREHLSATDTFNEILLTAPDIDVQEFSERILPAIESDRRHVTLYASDKDRALYYSGQLRKYRRLGEGGENLFVNKAIESIDASALDTDFLAHSYYGDHVLVVKDMAAILRDSARASQRGLEERSKDGLPYWVLHE